MIGPSNKKVLIAKIAATFAAIFSLLFCIVLLCVIINYPYSPSPVRVYEIIAFAVFSVVFFIYPIILFFLKRDVSNKRRILQVPVFLAMVSAVIVLLVAYGLSNIQIRTISLILFIISIITLLLLGFSLSVFNGQLDSIEQIKKTTTGELSVVHIAGSIVFVGAICAFLMTFAVFSDSLSIESFEIKYTTIGLYPIIITMIISILIFIVKNISLKRALLQYICLPNAYVFFMILLCVWLGGDIRNNFEKFICLPISFLSLIMTIKAIYSCNKIMQGEKAATT